MVVDVEMSDFMGFVEGRMMRLQVVVRVKFEAREGGRRLTR